MRGGTGGGRIRKDVPPSTNDARALYHTLTATENLVKLHRHAAQPEIVLLPTHRPRDVGLGGA